MYSVQANQLFRAEIEVKRSRFIGSLKRCESEVEARDFIAEIRSEYSDARHNCTAFKIATETVNPICRSSDDGEPAGTAGMPMLEALGEMTDIAVVVTRYFGGIKLGTGGLVRAYTAAVKNTLAAAQKVEILTYPSYYLDLSIAEASRLEGILLANDYQIHNRQWQETVRLQLLKKDWEKTELEIELSGWLSRGVRLEESTELVVEFPLQ